VSVVGDEVPAAAVSGPLLHAATERAKAGIRTNVMIVRTK
jgi:hypothetical protein